MHKLPVKPIERSCKPALLGSPSLSNELNFISDVMFESRYRVGVNEDIELPIFVCLLAFPSLKYPLYIFEPRYQLMIRRCVELGSRMFGMCAFSEDPDKEFSDYGTILRIENVSFLPDGRSIVETTAVRRYRAGI